MPSSENKEHVLTAGRNCWRLAKAQEASLLIDGAAYFKSFRQAAMQARRSLFIVGWDIDSRMELVRCDPRDELPVELGAFLHALVERNDELEIFILLWDYALLLGMDREWFPEFKIGDKAHARLHLRKDDHCPLGSSHHQKVVVIDDALAFVGGLDLSKDRWDRPGHHPDDPVRVNHEGQRYRPNHDVQVLVSGQAAHYMGELVRQRWRRAGGDGGRLPELGNQASPCWPEGVVADLRQVTVGFSRTMPAYGEQQEIREIEQFYLDAIAAARQSIYIENQYFTAPVIVDALVRRLAEPDGPEVVIVVPQQTDGWLSQLSMDLLRARAFRELRRVDHHSRLLICYPHRHGLAGENSVKVHAKLMVVDNRLLHVGSANLNNRSMGIDTECDVTIEARGDQEVEEVIGRFRQALLCEHLDVSREQLQEALASSSSLLAAIAQCNSGTWRLEEVTVEITKAEELWLENRNILDPERPIRTDRMLREVLPVPDSGVDLKVVLRLGSVLLFVVVAAGLWFLLPTEQYLESGKALALLDWVREQPVGPLVLMAIYVVASLLITPITLLISATILLYGPVLGAVYALTGSVLSAAVTYYAGVMVNKSTLQRFSGRYLDKVNRFLARKGIISTAVVRLFPLAPFTVINMLAGASHLRFGDYIFGTLLGMTPGILAIAGLLDRGAALFREPSISSLLLFGGLVALLVAGYRQMKKWLPDYQRAGERKND